MQHAAAYIQNKGYEILYENYRRSRIEIDVVARKENVLVIIELKYRKNEGLPCDPVSGGQMQRILNAAMFLWRSTIALNGSSFSSISQAKFRPELFPIEC